MSLQALAEFQRQLAGAQVAAAAMVDEIACAIQRAQDAERRERAMRRQLDALLSEVNDDERQAYRRGYLAGRGSVAQGHAEDPDTSFERGRGKRERSRRRGLEAVA